MRATGGESLRGFLFEAEECSDTSRVSSERRRRETRSRTGSEAVMQEAERDEHAPGRRRRFEAQGDEGELKMGVLKDEGYWG
jgi:hypothetical protein